MFLLLEEIFGVEEGLRKTNEDFGSAYEKTIYTCHCMLSLDRLVHLSMSVLVLLLGCKHGLKWKTKDEAQAKSMEQHENT